MKATTLVIAAAACFIGLISWAVPASQAADGSAPTTSPDQTAPAKFYGTITAIDADAKTFTIDDKTYSVVGESQMTKAADDSSATIADAVVGQPARGSYTTSSDGKLVITKVRFGKKTGGSKGGKSGGKKKNKDATTQPQT